MPYNRLYFLKNNHVRRYLQLDCESDALPIIAIAEHRTAEGWTFGRVIDGETVRSGRPRREEQGGLS